MLASACNPDSLLPPSAGLAGADEVITTPGANLTEDDIADDWDYEDDDYEDERGRP